MPQPREVSDAEAATVTALALLAAPILAAYLLDRIGLPFRPISLLIVTTVSTLATFLWLRPRASGQAGELAAFSATVLGVLAWLLWSARPNLLPPGSGPDLTHHLLLIDYIERHWRLVHDPRAEAYLGEMVQYTPGSQLLAALAGAWTGTDGFRAIYPVVAASVALKFGFLYLIVLRLIPRDVPRIPLALTSVALLLLPRNYVLGSFMQDSFFAQVVSELFAVAMWWALTAWDDGSSVVPAATFAVAGSVAFLTWPIWTGATLLALALTMSIRTTIPWRARLLRIVAAGGPVVVVAAVYMVGRLGWVGIVGTGGVVLRPSIHEFGWWFLGLSVAGFVLATTTREGRTTTLLMVAVGLEALGLLAVARTRGDETPYLALKMMYLAIYPMAAAATLTIATLWQVSARAVPHGVGRFLQRGRAAQGLAWLLLAAISVGVARPIAAAKRPAPVVSLSLYQAGRWARAHVPPECVDYLIGDDFTAYWLHLAVLGNPRMSARTADNATFEHQAALIRWLTPGGLPYAVAELPVLPRDVRADFDTLADFGSAAVVKRRGESSCQGSPLPKN